MNAFGEPEDERGVDEADAKTTSRLSNPGRVKAGRTTSSAASNVRRASWSIGDLLTSGYAEEDHVARIGTEKRPAVLRVQTERRAQEVANICAANGIHFIVGLEPDKPEDVSDMDRALRPPEPVLADPKIGRNDPCPCGSGRKFKKCCAAALPPGA